MRNLQFDDVLTPFCNVQNDFFYTNCGVLTVVYYSECCISLWKNFLFCFCCVIRNFAAAVKYYSSITRYSEVAAEISQKKAIYGVGNGRN
jgi:hypothetical protein